MDGWGPLAGDGGDGDGGDAEGRTEGSGECAGERCFEGDLTGDVGAGGAEGSSESDLGASFDDVEEGGVGDGDGADEQRECGEGVEQ